MTDTEKAQFKQSLVYPPHQSLRFVDNRVVLDDAIVCTIPHTKINAMRQLYLANSVADPVHMHMCIVCVFMGYKFCKNYITLFVRKYPLVCQDVTNPDTYTLYAFDTYFGSAGVFTDRVDIAGKCIYTPISEIAKKAHEMGAFVFVPDKTSTDTVELSNGRQIFKISIGSYKPDYINLNIDATENQTRSSRY